jgi:hypothetical protein
MNLSTVAGKLAALAMGILLIGAVFFLATAPAHADLILTGNSSSQSTGLIPDSSAPDNREKIDNQAVPPSFWRNFYYDADGDLAFTSPGDTSGNTTASLGLNITITGTKVLNFYVDDDGQNRIGQNFAANAYNLNGLTITLSDLSTIPLNVHQGTPQLFTDPGNSLQWSVSLDGVGYLTGATTDIVGNTNSVGDGQGPDYHWTLTFTQIPEPSTALLAGLALVCGFCFHRRRQRSR